MLDLSSTSEISIYNWNSRDNKTKFVMRTFFLEESIIEICEKENLNECKLKCWDRSLIKVLWRLSICEIVPRRNLKFLNKICEEH